MPLQSQLFSGDMKLEAAAVSDSAHIVPGAIAEHVRKIQLGLIQVNGASLSPDGVYGAAKAAAVLAYKQRHGKFGEPGGGGVPSVRGGRRSGAGIGPDRPLVPMTVNQQVVVIAPQQIGIIRTLNRGGVLVLSEPPDQNTTRPIAKLVNGASLRTVSKLENADIVDDPETLNYRTFGSVGTVKVQAVARGSKKLVSPILLPVHAVDSAFASGLAVTFTGVSPSWFRQPDRGRSRARRDLPDCQAAALRRLRTRA